jgi:hypothetical protein
MIIKRWNTDTSAWVEHYPKTVTTQVFNSSGGTSIFDGSDKLLPRYIPDSIMGGMKFAATVVAADVDTEAEVVALVDTQVQAYLTGVTPTPSLAVMRGVYWVASGSDHTSFSFFNATNTGGLQAGSTGRFYCVIFNNPNEEGSGTTSTFSVETGDWVVITGFSGSGVSGTPYLVTLSVINNTYGIASSSNYGVVKLNYSDNNKNYRVQTTTAGLFVNVPWDNTTYSAISEAEIDGATDDNGRLITGRRANYLLRNNVTATTTASLAIGQTASGNTKTVNIGTGGLATSTTNINIGSTAGAGAISLHENTTINGNGTITGTLGVTGNTTLTADLAVNGGDITTSSATFVIGNTATSAQTLSLGTAATGNGITKAINLGTGGATGSTTNVNIGAAAGGTTTIASPTTTVSALNATNVTLTGDIAVNGGDITSTSATLNIGNTATSVQTLNLATAATANATIKTVNIATGGATGSTTNVTIGGSAGGTTTIASVSTAIRAASTASAATQIPVFISDPTTNAQNIVTRTPAQLVSDLGLNYSAGVGIEEDQQEFSMVQPHVVSAAQPAAEFQKANTLWFDI